MIYFLVVFIYYYLVFFLVIPGSALGLLPTLLRNHSSGSHETISGTRNEIQMSQEQGKQATCYTTSPIPWLYLIPGNGIVFSLLII